MWTFISLFCVIIQVVQCVDYSSILADCSDVPHLVGADIVSVQMSVLYECKTEGYVFGGKDVYTEKTCKGNETGWIGPQPTCQAINCGEPPPVPNAIVERNTTSLGGMAQYLCSDGYKLEPETATLQCASSAKWTGEVPKCVRISCPIPANPANGSVTIVEGGNGYTASYACQTGYQLQGDIERTCQTNASWTGEEPFCEIVTCPFPALAFNVQIHPSLPFYEYAQTIKSSCDEGYRITGGDEYRFCGPDGTFSGASLVCAVDFCAHPIILTHSHLVHPRPANYWVNFTITLGCLEGYKRLSGDFEQTCQADRSWQGDPLFCEPIHCLVPTHHQHVTYNITGLIYGSKVNYECEEGYEQVRGDMARTCEGQGTWSGSPPECRRMSCSRSQLNVPYARLHINGLLFQDTVTYTCHDGYYWTGGDVTRRCLGDKTWSGQAPSCSPVSCQIPPVQTAGSRIMTNLTSFTFGQTVQYQCSDGFVFSEGSLYIKCENDGQWNASLPTCREAICATPPSPAKGYVTMISGSHAVYKCETGYMLEGEGVRSCDSLAGTWSGRPPECKVISCPPPPSIPHATLTSAPEQSWRSVLQFECHGGYTLHQGQGRLTCGAAGRWEGDLPVCNPVNCGKPPKPPRGIVHYASTQLGSLSVSSCDEGYEIIDGDAYRYCTSVGSWNGQQIICDAIICPPPYIPPNTELTNFDSAYALGSSAELKCIVGYKQSSGNATRKCTIAGDWDGEPLECKAIECEHLQNNIFTEVLHTQRTYGALAAYHCNSGSVIISGDRLRTCLADGNWSGIAAECEPIGCPEPLANNAIAVDVSFNYTFGSSILFECFPGYFPVFGEKRINCTEYGSWDGYPLSCGAVECSLSERTTGVRIVEYNTSFNKTAVFSCEEGYRFVSGAFERRCLADGSWEGDPLQCEEILCDNPPELPRSRLLLQGRRPGDQATYYCDTGPEDGFYRISQITCREDGTWSDDFPECENMSCPSLAPVADAHNRLSGYYPGDSVTYTCHEGFFLNQGTEYLRFCMPDGKWTGSEPVCRRQSCGFPPPVQYAKINGTGLHFGDLVEYECFKDYFLAEGDSNRTCQADGTWSGLPPRCQRVFVPVGPGEPTVDPTAEPDPDKPKLVGKRYVFPTVEAVQAPAIGSLVLTIVLIVIGVIFLLDILTYYKNFCYMKNNLSYWCIPAMKKLCSKCAPQKVNDNQPNNEEANPENGEISERTEPADSSSKADKLKVRNGVSLNRGSISLRGAAKNPETLTDDDQSVELTACRYAKRINTTPYVVDKFTVF